MRWLILTAVAASVVVLTAPVVLLVVVVDGGGPGVAVALAGFVLAGQAVGVGPVLRASAPSRGAARPQRWRVAVPAVAATVGVALVLGGVWASEGAAVALAVAVVHAVLLLMTLLPLLRWARRVATTSPMDVAREGDDARLSTPALRRRLLRAAALGLGLGLLVAVAGVVALVVGGRPLRETAVLGVGALVMVSALVVAGGTAGPMFAAARRMNEVVHHQSRVGWRVAWAIQVGRTRRLSPADHAIAVRWAHAAQPSLLLQIAFQLAVLTFVLLCQLVPLLLEPELGFRFWLVLAMSALLLVAAVLFPQQYVATRRFARAHPLPVEAA